MGLQTLWLLYAAVFVCALLLVQGVYLAAADLRGSRSRAANRRMRMLTGGMATHEALNLLRRGSDDDGEGFGPLRWLDQRLTQAGMTASASAYGLGMVGGAVAVAALAILLLNVPVFAAIPLGLLAGFVAPALSLSSRAAKRKKVFARQLPDALDMIVRSLRAGHPVTASLRMVAEEMSDPIGTEMGLVVDEMTYGLDLTEALDKLRRRIRYPDLDFMVVAIRIQHQSGGNLAEILYGLSQVIRRREQMFRKIRAVSAEGRLSAWFISLLPFIVGGAILALNPVYFMQVKNDPLLPWGMGLAGLLLTGGIVMIYRMVNFRV